MSEQPVIKRLYMLPKGQQTTARISYHSNKNKEKHFSNMLSLALIAYSLILAPYSIVNEANYKAALNYTLAIMDRPCVADRVYGDAPLPLPVLQ